VAAGAVRGTFGDFARGLSNMLDQDKDICADLPAAGSGDAAAAGSSTRQLTRRLLPASAASGRRQHLKIIRCAAVGLCNSCMHNITVRGMGRWGHSCIAALHRFTNMQSSPAAADGCVGRRRGCLVFLLLGGCVAGCLRLDSRHGLSYQKSPWVGRHLDGARSGWIVPQQTPCRPFAYSGIETCAAQ
jgi:hypothetical protein